MEQFLTVREIAVALRCSEEHVRRLSRTGKLRSVRLGDNRNAAIRVSRQDVDDYIASRVRSVAA